MTDENIKKDLENIAQDINEERNAYKEVEAQEEKGSVDVLSAEKAARISESVDTQQRELKNLQDQFEQEKKAREQHEIVSKRPASGSSEKMSDSDIETKKWDDYLRYGDRSEHASEMKNFFTFKNIERTYQKTLRNSELPQASYLTRHEMSNTIVKRIQEISPVRTIARVISIMGKDYSFPKRTEITKAVWVSENEDRPETGGFKLGEDTIVPGEMYCDETVTREMLEDAAFNVQGELSESMAIAFGQMEAQAFINGDGHNKPSGFANNSLVPTFDIGSAAAFTGDALSKMAHLLKSGYFTTSSWVMNLETIGAVRRLKSNDQYIMSPDMQIAGSPFGTLFGRPIVELPQMDGFNKSGASAANPNVAVGFGDFGRGYTVVDRVGMEIMRDDYQYQRSGKILFWARKRVGGQVVLPEALVMSNTDGAFPPNFADPDSVQEIKSAKLKSEKTATKGK